MSKNGFTPLPWSLSPRPNMYKVEGAPKEMEILINAGINPRFEALSIGGGPKSTQVCFIPLDESSSENAKAIVHTMNLMPSFIEAVKAVLAFEKKLMGPVEFESSFYTLRRAVDAVDSPLFSLVPKKDNDDAEDDTPHLKC